MIKILTQAILWYTSAHLKQFVFLNIWCKRVQFKNTWLPLSRAPSMSPSTPKSFLFFEYEEWKFMCTRQKELHTFRELVFQIVSTANHKMQLYEVWTLSKKKTFMESSKRSAMKETIKNSGRLRRFRYQLAYWN